MDSDLSSRRKITLCRKTKGNAFEKQKMDKKKKKEEKNKEKQLTSLKRTSSASSSRSSAGKFGTKYKMTT